MRVLVTGKTGQLVQSLMKTPLAGLEWVAVGRPEVDLAEPGALADAIQNARPDLVFNAAAYTAVDQAEDEPALAFRINSDAAGEAAKAAREIGVPIIQISTDYVFDGSSEGAISEGATTNPINVYGRSKLAGEEQVRRANPDHLIVRTAWVYSPFGRNFARSIMRAAGDRAVLTVVGDQYGSPTYAPDLAAGLATVIAQWRDGEPTGLGETYHLAGTGRASWCELAAEVMARCRLYGLDHAAVHAISTAEWPTRAARPRNSLLDSGKFMTDFGFVMPDWRVSVATLVDRLASER